MSTDGYEVIEDKGRYRIAQDKFVRWKREGKVLTMQRNVSDECDFMKEVWQDVEYEKHTMKIIPKLKKMGIEIIEFWVPKNLLEVAKAYYAKLGLKFEIIREEKETFFCRLLL